VLGEAAAAVARWYAWLVARTTLYTRSVLGITAAICLALLIFGAGEAWLNHQVHVRVEQVQRQNARLRQDTATTLRQAEWAESAGAIEDAARAMGYARPGEQPVVIVVAKPTATPKATPTQTPLPAPAPAPKASAPLSTDQRTQTGSLISPPQILFGG
jgi:cell division protein FtsB